ncbi:FAD binding domain-containing protein [Myriangium duriaei CBS 260.36]|uniref:FAD binding domain-containing protein n=1 Tax=Myriangium duriaei CBS 260.36 TaxID=1168546 RepID=A0A9P4ISG3_9PEZI|nr:FAD binding domain-containing protein [Myriangium duriaei CBS 260.36]
MSLSTTLLIMKSVLLIILVPCLTQVSATHPSIEPQDLDIARALFQRGYDVSVLGPLGYWQSPVRRSEGMSCAVVCQFLDRAFDPDQVLLPEETAYQSFADDYWSLLQVDARPSCVFQPSNSSQVSLVVLLTRYTKCPFAVKSGGHATFANASSISAGITISLEALNIIKLSEDRSTASIGPGNTWGAVFNSLGPHGLTVSGGRTGSVGVGGLLLGGGLPYLMNLHGWACDNVASFEVVVANGTILEASPSSNEDLYFALRGGGPNFGIVTEYRLLTHDLAGGSLWTSRRTYTSALDAAVQAFTDVGAQSATDLFADQWLTLSNVNGTESVVASLFHGTQDISKAAIFEPYTSISAEHEESTHRNLTAAAEEEAMETPSGYRQYFYTMTFKNDKRINSLVKDVFFQEYPAFDRVGGSVRLILQRINKPQLEQMQARGGNPLGLIPEDGPLTLVLLAATWRGAENDVVMYTAGSTILQRLKTEAVQRHLNKDFLYMNYVSPYQDAVASYGAKNKQKLMEIAHKYDPNGVFQRLQPGYAKLDRAAIPGTAFFNF